MTNHKYLLKARFIYLNYLDIYTRKGIIYKLGQIWPDWDMIIKYYTYSSLKPNFLLIFIFTNYNYITNKLNIIYKLMFKLLSILYTLFQITWVFF